MSRNISRPSGCVEKVEDLYGDVAGTHRSTSATSIADTPARVVECDLARLDRDGYLVVERLLPSALCIEIAETMDPLLGHVGRNVFEGLHTQRVYSLLTKARVCDGLVEHPRVLALLDRLLLPNYLLSQLQAIRIDPGETAQFLHFDDGKYPLPRPRAALSAATIWAISDFTADNGARLGNKSAEGAVEPDVNLSESDSTLP